MMPTTTAPAAPRVDRNDVDYNELRFAYWHPYYHVTHPRIYETHYGNRFCRRCPDFEDERRVRAAAGAPTYALVIRDDDDSADLARLHPPRFFLEPDDPAVRAVQQVAA